MSTRYREQRGTIIIPTPALSEFLVSAGDASGSYLDEIQGSRVFQVPPFDVKAAIEAASATRAALGRGDKRSGATGTWQKVKVDRQIVAVAKVHDAEVLYSDDADVLTLGQESGIPVVRSGLRSCRSRGSCSTRSGVPGRPTNGPAWVQRCGGHGFAAIVSDRTAGSFGAAR